MPAGELAGPDKSVRVAAGALPALLWLSYVVSNVFTERTISFGFGLTSTNLLYLAMLPAAVWVFARRRQHPWSGRVPYVLLLVWSLSTLLLHRESWPGDVSKRMLIFGLCALTVAAMIVGRESAHRWFATGVCLAAVGVSVWTIGHALTSGFGYRAGVPINPNLPATLIAPGLLISLALFWCADTPKRGWYLGITLVCSYACLLLGSRGVLLAVLAGVGTLVVGMRPARRALAGFAIGMAGVVAIAQMPAIPYGVWRAGVAMTQPKQAPQQPTTEASAPAAAKRSEVPPPPPPVELATAAAQSTAVARFGEEEVFSFNLRRDLWVAAGRFLASGPKAFLAGGGMGKSQRVANEANPVFHNIHNAFLQIWTDFGFIGLALFLWLNWQIGAHLFRLHTWYAKAMLACQIAWLTVGLTATVVDIHLYWVTLGVAATLTEDDQ